jgi:hypothetical protein
MSDESLVVIALPKGHPYAGAVPGSAAFDCDACRTPVMIAPSTREMMQKHGGPSRVLCLECGLRETEGKPTPTVVSASQLEEIASYFQRN